MIAIVVVASLVVYAWVSGYMGFQTSKTGKAIEIPSVALASDGLHVYVQNVGQSDVTLGAVYVNDEQKDFTPDPNYSTNVLPTGETANILVDGSYTDSAKLNVKVTTTDGTFMTITGKPGSGNNSPNPTGTTTYSVNLVIGNNGASITANGEELTSSISRTYYENQEVTISAAAVPGYHFHDWVVTGSIALGSSSNTNPNTATINGEGSITADFEQDAPTTATLTVTFAGSGTGKVNDGTNDRIASYTQVYNIGDSVTLTPTADATSTFAGWSGDGTGSPQRTVQMNNDQSVTIAFNLKTSSNLIQNNGFESNSIWSESSGSGGSTDRHSSNNERSGSYCGHTSTQSPSGSNSYAALTQTLTSTSVSSIVDSSSSLTVYLRRPNTARSGTDSVEITISAGNTKLSYIWCSSGSVPSETSTQKYIRIGDVNGIPTNSYTSLTRNLQSDWTNKGLSASLSITSIQLVSNGYKSYYSHSYHYYGQDIAWDDLQLIYYQ